VPFEALVSRFYRSYVRQAGWELSSEKGMVEAAGVEPAQDVENTQVVDSMNGQKGKKGQKGKSTVQTLYKNAFPRPPSHTLGTTQVSSRVWCRLKLIFGFCPLS
jgi:hypothetical protein